MIDCLRKSSTYKLLFFILRVRSVYLAAPHVGGDTLPGSLAARCGRHAVALGAAAGRTSLGLIGESLLGKELLFRCREGEILAAIAAFDGLVLIAH